MRRLILYARTLPHLKLWQIVGRIVAPIRRRLSAFLLPESPRELVQALQPAVPFVHHDPGNSEEALLAGRFTFLNQSENLGRPVDWRAEGQPLLWRFNLHYFNYLHLLPPDDRIHLCREWISSHETVGGMAWHPYPMSLRIVNWCKERFLEPDILESLYRQAAYLHRNLETYVYGNHLVENARALVFAGLTFGDVGEAPKWLERGLAILRGESDEQILADGGHYERSPMYQALMLEAWLDVVNVVPESHLVDRDGLINVARRMEAALRAMTHPDGQIALLNDSTTEIAPPTDRLHAYAEALCCTTGEPPTELPGTGYYMYRDKDIYLIVDGGPGGPDHLMAHAHADIFSYELSIGGLQFVVDSGVFDYAAGEERDHCRSTRAHNTVEIDGRDQIECWNSFRVGRRSAPTRAGVRSGSGKWVFEGRYDGYGQMIGGELRHVRRIEVKSADRRISVFDDVRGFGLHRLVSRVHLHPDVQVTGGGTLQLARENVVCELWIESGIIERKECWYFPEFGSRVRTQVVEFVSAGMLPERLSYSFRF